MNNFFRALQKSVLTIVSIHLLAFVLLLSLNRVSYPDIFRVLPMTMSLGFISVFLSVLFYENIENKLRGFIYMSFVIFLSSILLIFIIDKGDKNLINSKGLFIGIIGIIIGALSFLIQLLIKKDKTISEDKSFVIKYNINQIIVIPLFGVLCYSILIYFWSSSSLNILTVWTKLFPIGFLVTFLSFHYFNQIYNRRLKRNRTKSLLILYFTIIFLLVLFLIFSSDVFFLFKGDLRSRIEMISIPIIVLYFPYFLYIMLATHLYFLRLLSYHEKEQLKQKSLDSEINYSLLKKQMSPHFLFNNINVLTGLIEESPNKAINFSQSLSDVYRYFLDNEKNDVLRLKNEIKFAESYLELMKMRFEDGVQLKINISEDAKEKYILVNSLQQVLENIFKHNEVSYEVPMEIEIYSENNYLVVKNKRNNKYSEFRRKGIGINNIKKRYAFFSDDEVKIEEFENIYIIRLPLLSE